jgi:topoisomerase IA-like protein
MDHWMTEETNTKSREFHYHPGSGNKIFGRRLAFGEYIQSGDVYNSTFGSWMTDQSREGLVIEKGCTTYWVRPESPVPDKRNLYQSELQDA